MTKEPEYMGAIRKGYQAVAEILWQGHVDRFPTDKEYPSVENFIPLAKRAVDAWMIATNPTGLRPSETIYDEFYRLRLVARLSLRAYDDGKPIEESMEGLRAALIAMSVPNKEGDY